MIKRCSVCKDEKNLDCFNKRKASVDGYSPKCKLCANKYDQTFYNDNKKYKLKYQTDYAKAHKQEKYIYDIRYRKHKMATDSTYRLKRNCRKRVWDTLRGFAKAESTFKLIGCDADTLWKHLEAKFQPGMTRENYGQWHVDHITPCAKYNFNNPDEQRACFHYTNLQPLWGSDNLKKAAK